MTAERYWHIKSIFHQALQQPRANRADFVANACHNDPELLREVIALVDSDSASGDFLEEPVVSSQFRSQTRAAAETASRQCH